MDGVPGTANGSGPFSGNGYRRDPCMMSRMSIPELVSEVRDAFRQSDFDLVEEALLAREARLYAEIEEKRKEIGLLQKKFNFEKLEKMNAQFELKRVKGGSNGVGFDGVDVKGELGCESGKLEGLKNGNGSVAVGEVKAEKVEFLVEKKKGLDGNPSKENGVGASGGKLAMGNVINIEDSDEEVCDSQGTLNRKETTSCVIADNKYLLSSGAVQGNLTTGLDKSNGVLKRKFSASDGLNTNINMEKVLNILDDLGGDSSSSSSSSSSGSLFDIDSLPTSSVTSNKKMRTDAASFGLNSRVAR